MNSPNRLDERYYSIFPSLMWLPLTFILGCSGSEREPAGAMVGGTAATAGAGLQPGSGTAHQTLGGASYGGAAAAQGGLSSGGLSGLGKGQGGADFGGSLGRGGDSAIGVGGRAMGGGSPGIGGRSSRSSSRPSADQTAGGMTNGGASGTSRGGMSDAGAMGLGGLRATGGDSPIGTGVSGGGKTAGGSKATGGSGVAGRSSNGGTAVGGGSAGTLSALTIYIAGDSTVVGYKDTGSPTDQAGWGQMLPPLFNDKVKVDNRAAGGRTAYWFYLEGGVGKVLDAIKPGDYFFIQFGTNDQNETATFTVGGKEYPRYADAQTDFKSQLKQYYLDPTKAKGAIPVLVTPPPRNSAYCNGGNGLAAYATAMVQLGAAEQVTVIDNNLKTFNYLKAICPKPTTAANETFFLGKSDGSIDGTHFRKLGASTMAGFIADGIREAGLGLAQYLR